MQSNQVSLKGRPNLALEDLAGHRPESNVFRLLALELSLVPIVHLLNDKRDPTNRRLGETELQFGMSLQCSEVKKIDKGIEKRSRAVAEPHIESHLALIRLECLRRGPDGSRLKAAADVVRHDDVGLLGGIPEHVPRFEVHIDRYIVYQEVGFAKAQFCYPSDLLPWRLPRQPARAWQLERIASGRPGRTPSPSRCRSERKHSSVQARPPAWQKSAGT